MGRLYEDHGPMRAEYYNETSGTRIMCCEKCGRRVSLIPTGDGMEFTVLDTGDFWAAHQGSNENFNISMRFDSAE